MTTPMIVEDLALFALQAGPQTSSQVAKLLGVDNKIALQYLRAQIASGYVVERYESGSRVFELVSRDTNEVLLND